MAKAIKLVAVLGLAAASSAVQSQSFEPELIETIIHPSSEYSEFDVNDTMTVSLIEYNKNPNKFRNANEMYILNAVRLPFLRDRRPESLMEIASRCGISLINSGISVLPKLLPQNPDKPEEKFNIFGDTDCRPEINYETNRQKSTIGLDGNPQSPGAKYIASW